LIFSDSGFLKYSELAALVINLQYLFLDNVYRTE